MPVANDRAPVRLWSAAYSAFAARSYQAQPALADFVAAQRDRRWHRESIAARLDAHLAHDARFDHVGPLGHADRPTAVTPARRDASGANAALDEGSLGRALRRLRLEVFCVLMERDLAGDADLDEVMATMSALAEVCVARALQAIEADLQATFGAPCAASDGAPLTLGVVGMGKLGGSELNVSSDIDLIFVYEEDGQTAGALRAPIANHDFFTRLARRLIGLLSERTADGYVFRVDMRLRPNGDSGALVTSLPMLEEYFYVQGREWERYAWIKARLLPSATPASSSPSSSSSPASSSSSSPAWTRLSAQLDALVRPFVFRRYLDFGVIDAIRSLHQQIGQEARRRASLRPSQADDVKLGRGGIREIEFAAQVFQLIRGGQDAGLRVRPTLQVLAQAAARGLIAADACRGLSNAYTFLRRLEHRLQYVDDAQTHAIPVDPQTRAQLALAMGCADYGALQVQLEQHRGFVEREFDQIFDKPDAPAAARAPGETAAGGDPLIACLWSDALLDTAPVGGALLDVEVAAMALAAGGAVPDAAFERTVVQRAADAVQGDGAPVAAEPVNGVDDTAMAAALTHAKALVARLRAARTSLRYLQMPQQSRVRFDALVWRAIEAARALHSGVEAGAARLALLSRLLDLLERIAGRSAYLALLTEFPAALNRVFAVLDNSAWAARYLISHPQLLDELLDDEAIDAPFDWPAFAAGLRARLAASDGIEQQMDLLRHAQHAEVFRILLRDLAGRIDVETIGDRLSELADTILAVTLETVWRTLSDRPALPGDLPQFAIVAYGKLGGKELGYASDLDLIFLYDDAAPADAATDCYARLARRLVTWLTTATAAGQLYDVDLRLRPNGSSGLLVTPFTGFRQYQLREGGVANAAWVWEHQALTRARFCAGDARIGAAFEAVRATVLATRRQPEVLAREIVEMRQRTREGHPNRSARFDLKHDRGGMVDIEFIVQYLVLLHAADHQQLIRNTGNINLLSAFAALGILTDDEAQVVGAAYRRYRALQHRLRLDGASDARVDPDAVAAERRAVMALWTRIFGAYETDR